MNKETRIVPLEAKGILETKNFTTENKNALWRVSPKAEGFLEAKKLLKTVPWNRNPQKPLNLAEFLKNFYKAWPFDYAGVKWLNDSLNLFFKGDKKPGKISIFLKKEIESYGNKIGGMKNIGPATLALLVQTNTAFSFQGVSVFKEGFVFMDIHLFSKESVLDSLHLLTND